MTRSAFLAPAVVLLSLASCAFATEYDVGAGYAHTTLSSLLPSLQAGDIVDVHPGTYNEIDAISCTGTLANPITIRGVGATQPIFDATGLDPSGSGSAPRGVFEIRGDNIVIQNLEFKNADNGNNGAGIRIREDLVNNCTISNITSDHNDMGIQGGVLAGGHLVVQNSNIGFNGTPAFDGFSHNFYLTGAGSATIEGNYIHDAQYGQNFKSRMHYTQLMYNYIANSNEGEVGPVDDPTYTSVPNSNMLMVGNTIISKSNRTGNTAKFVNFGGDGSAADHNGTLYAYNNTMIANSSSINYLWVSPTTATNSKIVASNNVMFDPTGKPTIVDAASPTGTITGSNDWWLSNSTTSPGVFTSTLTGSDPGFTNFAAGDYTPLASSPLVNAAASGLTYVDGDGITHSLSVDYEYILGQGMVPRVANGALDIGAYEAILVPEPGTLSILVSIGVLAAVRRRRK